MLNLRKPVSIALGQYVPFWEELNSFLGVAKLLLKYEQLAFNLLVVAKLRD